VKVSFVKYAVCILSFVFVCRAAPASPLARTVASDAESNAVIQDVCVLCHNDTTLLGNLSLETFDATAADRQPETAEKVIRKLRAGMMPPPGIPRPDESTMQALVETVEAVVDASAGRPNPGMRSFQRLNRAEYEHAIHDLLSLEVDAGSWLPLDQMSSNFDNIADAQTLSPTLLEAYLNAASDISRMAIGDRSAPSLEKTYTNPIYVSQHPWDHIEGTPYGTRGGIAVEHVFPADAEYVFEMTFGSGENSQLEDVDVSIDGERAALVRYTLMEGGADGRGGAPIGTEPIFIRAGQHEVSAAFVKRSDGPYEDLIRPHDWSFAGGGSGGLGITTLPHLQSLVVRGPLNATGLSESASRKRIFTCRPTTADEERPCAEKILDRLASEAYRRPAVPGDLEGLMQFYDTGAAKGGFEIGVRTALEAILASPYFVLRLERVPRDVRPGQEFRVADADLASRLSFFLWGSPPDEELQRVASEGRLGNPGELERQTRRMLEDPRSEALGTRFAAQWFRLQDLYKVHPDPNFYPNFDENLADAMRRETELFFYDLVRKDRSLLDLFTADYTFVNERLARHYGIAGVAGREFRKVAYPDDSRRGILGQGSVLVLTSLANRTSPVLRGKWVMEVLMGTPPPPPPPNVPDLDQTAGVQNGRMLTTRERMEIHRANPTCNSCHRMMDPIGLSLDNFDVTAKWRVRENGEPLDTQGEFYDGTSISSERELVDVLLKRPEPLVRTFTENLMAFALGRRVEYYDQPTIRAIVKEAEANGYRMSSFILGVVRSDAFQMKREAPVATDETVDASRQEQR
jgi:Protein of unknown function (DUF1592)/Protein of unknown function (DUF1588)/Protein of unknown function (DUF1585)/Protein of unknown function (DUF1587)/Protein of unknown function (DUF1595)